MFDEKVPTISRIRPVLRCHLSQKPKSIVVFQLYVSRISGPTKFFMAMSLGRGNMTSQNYLAMSHKGATSLSTYARLVDELPSQQRDKT
jgi:hypothetical protein